MGAKHLLRVACATSCPTRSSCATRPSQPYRTSTAATASGASRRRRSRACQLLTGSEGGENEKLIFKVLKRGENLDAAARAGEDELADLGLRYDLTVPLARYYAENHARAARPVQGDPDRPGVARRAAPEGALPPVHPVRYRRARRGLGGGRDRADPGDVGGAGAAGTHRLHRAHQRPPHPRADRPALRLRRGLGSVFITLDKLDKIGLDGVRRASWRPRLRRRADPRLWTRLPPCGRIAAIRPATAPSCRRHRPRGR